MRLRHELLSNSTNMPIANRGNQDIETVFVPATEYQILWSHPDIYEGFCAQKFKRMSAAMMHVILVYSAIYGEDCDKAKRAMRTYDKAIKREQK